jgi:hypothetical protein
VGEESPVHKHFDELRAAALSRNPQQIRKEALRVLQLPRLRFWHSKRPNRKWRLHQVINRKGELKGGKFDRVGAINKAGDCFSAMEQGDLGLGFFNLYTAMAGRGDQKEFKLIYKGALDAMCDPVDRGGLRLGSAGGWMIGQTTYKDDDYGLTLNKALNGLRSLWAVGTDGGHPAYQNAAVASLAYMGRRGSWTRKGGPTIYDYIPNFNGWLLYGASGDTGRPYYLKNDPRKNGDYHMYVIRLLAWMTVFMGARFPSAEWTNTAQLGQSPLRKIRALYLAKGNPLVDSPGWIRARPQAKLPTSGELNALNR